MKTPAPTTSCGAPRASPGRGWHCPPRPRRRSPLRSHTVPRKETLIHCGRHSASCMRLAGPPKPRSCSRRSSGPPSGSTARRLSTADSEPSRPHLTPAPRPREPAMEITQDLDAIGSEPFRPLWSADDFDPPREVGITKYRADIGRGCTLDSLFVNKKSYVLLVSMHGALQRAKIRLP